MTERLAQLMHDEVDALEVPPVDHSAILSLGQQTRTRRRATVFLAAAAVVAVVGTGTALAINGTDDPHHDGNAIDAAATSGPSRGILAYGADSTVAVEGATATVPGTLHSLSYTSVGVLTRSNPNGGASDGSGPESLTLVSVDGTTTDLGTIPEGVGPATDPDEPVYALAEKSGDGFRAVVRDATTGEEVGSVALPDLPMSFWPVPPLALDGDVVYAGFKDEAVAFNWRTGEMQPAAGLGGGLPEVRGGHALNYRPGDVSVVDAATGDVLLDFELGEDEFGSGSLSPDGLYLRYKRDKVTDNDLSGGVEVYDLATGDRVQVPGATYEWGWTSDGSAFRVTGQKVQVCNPVSGACETETGPSIGKDLRLGGNTYES
jgi:hypothetical protein